MTPAINNSHTTMRPRHPMSAAPPLSTAARLEGLPHPSLGRLDPHAARTRGDDDFVGIPYCERCGTDEFVYLESFVPAKHHRDGSISRLGEVTYFCSGCEDFSAHAVPAAWVPPGWYLG